MSWLTQGWRFRPEHHAPHSFGRLGAFVDGVYAIGATLLVLDLRLPTDVHPGELGHALAELSGEYVAYTLGFLQMLGGWLQTRRIDAWMRGVDHYATLLIVAGLGVYSLTPFTTHVLAEAFGNSRDLGTAVRLTAAQLTAATGSWAVLLVYARRVGLFRTDLRPAEFNLYFHLGCLTWLVPVIAFLTSFVAPLVALLMLVALYVLALLPLEAHQPTPTP
jgi:uncharacterized membrane protein